MAKRYIRLDRPIKEIPADELRRTLGGLKISELMRTIILNEKEFLAVDYNRSLRGFWYATVKPALDKLGRLSPADQTEEELTRWDAKLSLYMADLVRDGLLTYRDLNIIDTSRQRANPAAHYRIKPMDVYGYQVNIAPYPNIILCTEKDTVYSIIADLARLFGLSCISGKGQNALGAMEDLIRGMGEAAGEGIEILTMTDYDPSGYYIADTFQKQARDLLRALGYEWADVSTRRIGITPDQLTAEEIEANKYTPKLANRAKWFKQTGGIGGQPQGLELDALPPDRIRDIFVTSLKNYIDPENYKAFIKRAYIQQVILKEMAGIIRDIERGAIAQEADNITLKDFNLFDLALEGFDFIPVNELCENDRDGAIKEAAINSLKALGGAY